MRRKHLSKGDVLIQEGTELTELYIIRSGRFRVFKTINGELVELATLKEKEFVGEISVLLGTPTSASVAAIEEAEVDALTESELAGLVKNRPEIGLGMIKVMAARLRRANELVSKVSGEKTSLEIIYGLRS